MESLYSRRSNLIIGFHGCDESVVRRVVNGEEDLIPSTNDYDWLGNGIYFWENNETRALQWATELSKRKGSSIKKPAVVGAIIDLGYCFDLTDSTYLQELKDAYDIFVKICHRAGKTLPENTDIGTSTDKLIRKLDCSVIQTVHLINQDANKRAYDSVKGVFFGRDTRFIPMPDLPKRTISRYVFAIRTASKDISFQEVLTKIFPTHKKI